MQETPIGRIVLRDAASHEWPDDGVPILVQLDTGGDDRYLGPTGAVDGLTDPGGMHHVALAIDLARHDTYEVSSNIVRADDTSWVNNRESPDAGITSEHGGGIDSPSGTVVLP